MEQTFSTLAPVVQTQYELHLHEMQRSAVGVGSETWFLRCEEGDYVIKFPAASRIHHPEAEPELCVFLRMHGIPACDFLKNKKGSYISWNADGRVFTVQRRFPGVTPGWNRASNTLLMESAELLGRIHAVLQAYPPLPEGIGAGFFYDMTPRRALDSYRRSLAAAIQLGEKENAEELEWRIDFAEQIPAWQFDLNRLTLRNTHGDYCINQFLCENGHLTAIIDWTTACVHPVIWEIMRSFVYSAPSCAQGRVDTELLERYVCAYCRYGTLNDYDRENLFRLYLYQIAVCDYYGQYYASSDPNRAIYLRQAQHGTRLLKYAGSVLYRE